ncbi:MAG: YggS family pyridoxal phosphate-dependent enzyme [Candidatus Pelethousia sp.]|nr:YggS family pyridoxal phosphate-dependent enzyme [Candidatus Pelethousia sp.]
MYIAQNYANIQENISLACQKAGRKPSEVRLIAVTKFVPVERIAEAVAAGAKEVGENRSQEFVSKLDFFKTHNLSAHLIGQLQTNKVKYVIGKAALIQSVDRLELAKEISRLAQKRELTQDVLVEVNIGEEPQKAGVLPGELPAFFDIISTLPGIQVKGLMSIPPNVGEGEVRPYFTRMRRLFEELGSRAPEGVKMEELSMGMSGDYTAAILEGATMVRVGTALFGARQQM